MRMSQTGAPLRLNNCWLAARLSCSRKLDVVNVDKSSGGLCNSVPRDGVAVGVDIGIPSPPLPPPQAASSSAANRTSDEHLTGRKVFLLEMQGCMLALRAARVCHPVLGLVGALATHVVGA